MCILGKRSASGPVIRGYIASRSRSDIPASSHENKVSVYYILAPYSTVLLSNATFKGPDREILDNFTSHWNETGWWANLLSALRLCAAAAAGGKKHFAKQHQVHKQATYLNEPDNYLNIFPLLLQWAAINERGRLKLVYVPKALISLRLTYEYGGGWLVWVEAIDSMYLRRCQARWIQTHSDGSCKKCRGGLCYLYTYAYPRAPPSHVINQIICLPARQSWFWI